MIIQLQEKILNTSQIIKMIETFIKSIGISCDSRLIFKKVDDKTVKLISTNDKKLQENLLGPTNWVKTLRFSGDFLLVSSI